MVIKGKYHDPGAHGILKCHLNSGLPSDCQINGVEGGGGGV